MKDGKRIVVTVEALEGRRFLSATGLQGYEGQPGNQGGGKQGNGQLGYEGQPGNQGGKQGNSGGTSNGLNGYEGQPGNQGG